MIFCSRCEKRPIRCKELCQTCYMRQYRNGGVAPSIPPKKYGMVATCHPERSHRAKGLCDKCYTEQWKRSKNIQKRAKSIIACGHSERKHYVHGLCKQCWSSSSQRRAQHAANMLDPVKSTHIRTRNRANNLKSRYGITLKDYDRMLQEQNGLCILCNRSPQGKTKLVVDHSHVTEKVRGLLCVPCNRALGYFENPEWHAKAHGYLTIT